MMQDHEIINADCLGAMQEMQDGCVDAIVTDPPYGLAFMGANWDHNVPSVAYWSECLRVAKSGAHLLCFGGTRTFHRLMCAIEDAGWEIRDTIMWVYGCLDEETEVLVDGEFVPYNKAKIGSLALGYDIERGTFSWQRIEDTYLYDYDDTAYAIQSDSTDQLVSRNHRCIVERGGVEQFALAELVALEREASVPVLEGLHGLFDHLPLPDERAGGAQQDMLERVRCGDSADTTEEAQGSRTEHDLSCMRQKVLRASCVAEESQDELLLGELQEQSAVPEQQSTQALRGAWGAKTTLARVTPVHYKGKMWCIKVATGAFVARRHGKIFITGNSGFPKSMDVGKAIDKALGAKREKVPATGGLTNNRNLNDDNWSKIGQSNPMMDGPEPATAAAWDGWGTCLKPAWEPIIVARKPLDGTVAHNVMEYGTGALNIDACRVGSDGGTRAVNFHGETGNVYGNGSHPKNDIQCIEKGRFPANLVHDGSQEVLELFPDTKGQKAPVKGTEPSRDTRDGIFPTFGPINAFEPRDGYGSAARFFYCAKASKKDRGEGNDHPTVKPNALMRWLVRLVCPQGGIVLDPFMGSGSTGVACVQEGMRFVGVEMDEHYCDIANTRISKEADKVFCENQ